MPIKVDFMCGTSISINETELEEAIAVNVGYYISKKMEIPMRLISIYEKSKTDPLSREDKIVSTSNYYCLLEPSDSNSNSYENDFEIFNDNLLEIAKNHSDNVTVEEISFSNYEDLIYGLDDEVIKWLTNNKLNLTQTEIFNCLDELQSDIPFNREILKELLDIRPL